MSSARQIADQIHAFLGDACSDMAHTVDLEFFDGKTAEAIKQAKKDGVRDLKGWLADYLYDDRDTLADFAGDKICDFCGDDKELRRAVELELEYLVPKLKGAFT